MLEQRLDSSSRSSLSLTLGTSELELCALLGELRLEL